MEPEVENAIRTVTELMVAQYCVAAEGKTSLVKHSTTGFNFTGFFIQVYDQINRTSERLQL